MKIRLILITPFLFPLFFSCQSAQKKTDSFQPVNPLFPGSEFIVFTDPHYFSENLFDSGSAFMNSMIWKKGNLTEYSSDIMISMAREISQSQPDFVLIPGDITNNGEKQSHIDFVHYLKQLEDSGTEVYVIPGNHDINSPHSLTFSGNSRRSTENISAGQFLSLYRDFGYNQAVSRDRGTLSYAAEPIEGLCLIGLDTCHYGYDEGFLYDETLNWLRDQLVRAGQKNQAVIIFMHHSLLEHYEGQQKDREMLLKNRIELREIFHDHGVSLVFTGHYHAQDIVSETQNNHSIYDIETGALISWPFPYRKITTDKEITEINSSFLKVPSLEKKGRERSKNRVFTFTNYFLSNYGVNKEDRDKIADYMSEIFLIHAAGDEPQPYPLEKIEDLSLWGKMALSYGSSVYKGRMIDLEPPDNDIMINTLTGSWSPLVSD